MYILRVRDHFDAAHYIKGYPGKCSREHGHRWEVELVLKGEKLDGLNMLIDFGVVKEVMKAVLDSILDHYQLNDQLGEPCVTAEYLSEWLYRQMKARTLGVQVVEVTIWESPDCSITFREE